MSDTAIGWTHMPGRRGVTWNPIRGCSRVSPGCERCYAEGIAGRFSGEGMSFEGYAKRTAAGARWTRKVSLLAHKLAEPLSWRDQRCCFANSMSDLFHEELSFEEIAAVVGIMAASPRHIFQTLTKRAPRMREWFEWSLAEAEAAGTTRSALVLHHAQRRTPGKLWRPALLDAHGVAERGWPLPNWWVGVSAEDQKRWDDRVPDLLRCPAAVRYVSAEPLLGPIDCSDWLELPGFALEPGARLHWIIIGAESGNGARPMETAWAESIRDQANAAGVAVYTKQFATAAGRKVVDPTKWPGVEIPEYLCRDDHADARMRIAYEVWPQEFPA